MCGGLLYSGIRNADALVLKDQAMKKRFQSVENRDLGLIHSEAVVDGIVQFDCYGNSVLHAAAEVGWVDGVRYIIDHRVLDVNILDPDGQNCTPLFVASYEGCAEVVRLLLSGGADPNIACWPYEETPLHLASRQGFLEVVASLIDGGANLEARDANSKSTPLLMAAYQNKLAIVKLLTDRGADLSATDFCDRDYKFHLEINERNPAMQDQPPDPELEKMIDDLWKLLDED